MMSISRESSDVRSAGDSALGFGPLRMAATGPVIVPTSSLERFYVPERKTDIRGKVYYVNRARIVRNCITRRLQIWVPLKTQLCGKKENKKTLKTVKQMGQLIEEIKNISEESHHVSFSAPQAIAPTQTSFMEGATWTLSGEDLVFQMDEDLSDSSGYENSMAEDRPQPVFSAIEISEQRRFVEEEMKFNCLEQFNAFPPTLRVQIGIHRFNRIYDELTSRVVCTDECESMPLVNLIDSYLTTYEDDPTLMMSEEHAREWVRAIINQSVCTMIYLLYRKGEHNVEIAGRTMIAPKFIVLKQMITTSTLRCGYSEDAHTALVVAIELWRAQFMFVLERALIAYRCSLYRTGSTQPEVVTDNFVRKLTFLKRQNCGMSITAMVTGNFMAMPEFQEALNDTAPHTVQMFSRAAKYMTASVGSAVVDAVADAAEAKVKEKVENSMFYKAGAAIASVGSAVGHTMMGIIGKLYEIFPKLAPIFCVIAAFIFANTGSKAWGLVAVLFAAQGAFIAQSWFLNHIVPMLSHMWSTRHGYDKADASDLTYLNNDNLLPDEEELLGDNFTASLRAYFGGDQVLSATAREINAADLMGLSHKQAAPSVETLSGILSAALLGTGIFLKDPTGLVSAFSRYQGVANGISGIVTILVTIFITITNHLVPDMSVSSVPYLGKDLPIVQYLEELQKVHLAQAKGRLPRTQDTLNRIALLIKGGREVMSKAAGSPLLGTVAARLASLERLERELAPKCVTTATRPKPVVVAFLGPPGDGKTVDAYALASLHCQYDLKKYDQEGLEIFKRAPGQYIFTMPIGKHMDGLNHTTKALVWDDYGQVVAKYADAPQGPTFIAMNGNQTVNPPMAHLENKNVGDISHELTVLTGNWTSLNDESMLEPDAFGRRVDFAYTPVLKQGVNLNNTKGFDPYLKEYIRLYYDPKTCSFKAVPNEKHFSFFEIAALVEEKVERNRAWFKSSQDDSELMFTDFDDFMETPTIDATTFLDTLATHAKFGAGKKRNVEDMDPEPAIRPVVEPKATKQMWKGKRKDYSYYLNRPDKVLDPDMLDFITRAFEAAHGDLPHDEKFVLHDQIIAHLPALYDFDKATIAKAVADPAFLEVIRWTMIPHEIPEDQKKLFSTKALFDFVKSAKNVVYDKAQDVVAYLKDPANRTMLIASGAAILTAAIGIFGVNSYVKTWFEADVQSDEKPATQKNAKARKGKAARRLQERAKVRAEKRNAERGSKFDRAHADESLVYRQGGTAIESLIQTIDAARFKIYLTYGPTSRLLGYGLGLTKRFFAVPAHFMEEALDVDESFDGKVGFTIVSKTGTYFVSLDDVEAKTADEECQDRIILEIKDNTFPAFKSIIKHLAPEKVLTGIMFTAQAYHKIAILFPGMAVTERAYWTPSLMVDDERRENLVSYTYATKLGDCGAPVLIASGIYAGKIVGIHFAGNGRVGHAARLPKDWVMNALFGGDYDPTEDAELISDLKDWESEKLTVRHAKDFHPEGGFNALERNLPFPSDVFIRNTHVPYAPNGEDKIPKERMLAASNTHPTAFTANRARFVEPSWSNQDWDNVKNSLADAVYNKISRYNSNGLEMRVWTFKEAVEGITDLELDALDQNTSPGYPYTAFGASRKTYFLKDGQGRIIPQKRWNELVEDVSYMRWLGEQGQDLPNIWKIIQKGEKLKKQKVLDGKTRDVNCPNLAFHILCRMYLGAAFELMKQGAPLNEMLITADASGARDWDDLAKYMMSYNGGKTCGAGDFAAFDHSHSFEMIMDIPAAVVHKLYSSATPREKRLRDAIFRNVANPKLVFGSVVEQRRGCMPSGFDGTTFFNCMINMALFRYAWMRLHDFDASSLLTFEENVGLRVCGDDNLFSVSKYYGDKFTESWCAECFAGVGYAYTAADKGPANDHNRPMTEQTILKRGFRYEKAIGYWLGPLDFNRAMEICMWTRSGVKSDEIGVNNVKTTVQELSLHGKETFGLWMPKILAHSEGHWFPESTDWNTVLRDFVGIA